MSYTISLNGRIVFGPWETFSWFDRLAAKLKANAPKIDLTHDGSTVVIDGEVLADTATYWDLMDPVYTLLERGLSGFVDLNRDDRDVPQRLLVGGDQDLLVPQSIEEGGARQMGSPCFAHHRSMRSIAAARSAAILATGSAEIHAGLVDIWNAETTEHLGHFLITAFTGPNHARRFEPVLPVAVAPDGSSVYAAGMGHRLFAFDVKTAALSSTTDVGFAPTLMAISDDGKWLALARDKAVKILEVDTWTLGADVSNSGARSLSWTSAGTLLVGQRDETFISVTPTGEVTSLTAEGSVVAGAGKEIVSATGEYRGDKYQMRVRVFDEAGATIREADLDREARYVGVDPVSQEPLFVTSRQVHFWGADGLTAVDHGGTTLVSAAVIPNTRELMIVDGSQRPLRFDLSKRTPIRNGSEMTPIRHGFPDAGDTFASVDGEKILLDGNPLVLVNGNTLEKESLIDAGDSRRSSTLSPDGHTLVVLANHPKDFERVLLQAFSTTDGEQLMEIPLEGQLNQFTILPGGRQALATREDQLIRLDLRTGEVVATGDSVSYAAPQVSPDGATALIVERGYIEVIDVETCTIRQVLETFDDEIGAAAWAPDSQRFAVMEGTTLLVLVRDSLEVLFRAPVDWVESIAYAPDGESILLGQWAGLALADPNDGTIRRRVSAHRWTPLVILTSPTGRVTTFSGDGTAVHWDELSGPTDPSLLLDIANSLELFATA